MSSPKLLSRSLALVTLALVLASGAAAQKRWQKVGPGPDARFGTAPRHAGDVNADGVPDVLVPDLDDETAGIGVGAAFVFSGLDGTLLRTVATTNANHRIRSAGAGGDLDGDGYDDIVIGGDLGSPNGTLSGSVLGISGQDGSVLLTRHGPAPNTSFGNQAAIIPDVNGDGLDDVAVGAYQEDVGGLINAGAVYVLSGGDGSTLHKFTGWSMHDELGGRVVSAGDIDGDGRGDVLAAARRYDGVFGNEGRVLVWSGFDGSVLLDLVGGSTDAFFGEELAAVGDVDGDGTADVAVGSSSWDDPIVGNDAGRVQVFAVPGGAQILEIVGESAGLRLGITVDGAGDVNGDGVNELAVATDSAGPLGAGYGSVRLYSGAPPTLLVEYLGDGPGDAFNQVAGIGDVDGDLLDEIVVGSPRDDDGGHDSGSLRLLFPTGTRRYGIGVPPLQALDLARLPGAPGAPTAGELSVAGALPFTVGLLVASSAPSNHYEFGIYFWIVVLQESIVAWAEIPLDANGAFLWAFDLDDPALAGTSLFVQAFAPDGSGWLLTSNGMEVRFAP